MRRETRWIALLGLLACGPALPDVEGSDGAATSAGAAPTTSETSASTGTGTTGAADTTMGSASGSDAGSAADASSDGGASFLVDLGGGPGPCDPFTQDCPDGEKCTPYADDGGSSWNSATCGPVVEDPAQLGEPCFAPGGGVAGIDSCDVGLMCWDVDAQGDGTCIELCHGSAEAGLCYEAKANCHVYSDGYLALCLPGCDPITQDCNPSEVCIGDPTGEEFLCVSDASGEEGQQHDPCMFAGGCDPGLLCNDPSSAVECDQDEIGCCEPFCDLSDPNADMNCGGEGQVCNPWFEEGTAPPDHEDVGFCAVPM